MILWKILSKGFSLRNWKNRTGITEKETLEFLGPKCNENEGYNVTFIQGMVPSESVEDFVQKWEDVHGFRKWLVKFFEVSYCSKNFQPPTFHNSEDRGGMKMPYDFFVYICDF